jgi:fosfomycin resistance protein FosX
VIAGLSHMTFIVRDLARMTELIQTVLDGREVYASGERTFSVAREKFFIVGAIWIAVMEGEPLKERSYNHVAFKIAREALPEYRVRVERLGLTIRESRPRVDGEGHSIYFYDDDNHLFELHAGTLQERLRRYELDKRDRANG